MRHTAGRRLLILVSNELVLTLPLENGLHTRELLETLALLHVLNPDPFNILGSVSNAFVLTTWRDIARSLGHRGSLLVEERLF